nr:hypothetical protein [Citrobacter freundii]
MQKSFSSHLTIYLTATYNVTQKQLGQPRLVIGNTHQLNMAQCLVIEEVVGVNLADLLKTQKDASTTIQQGVKRST